MRTFNDMMFDTSGDFYLDPGGDLKDFSSLKYGAIVQRVRSMLESSRGDWQFAPEHGADVSLFAGQPNTEAVGTRLKNNIMNGFLKLKMDEVSQTVDVFPVSEVAMGILISMSIKGSPGGIVLSYVFDSRDNKLVPRG